MSLFIVWLYNNHSVYQEDNRQITNIFNIDVEDREEFINLDDEQKQTVFNLYRRHLTGEDVGTLFARFMSNHFGHYNDGAFWSYAFLRFEGVPQQVVNQVPEVNLITPDFKIPTFNRFEILSFLEDYELNGFSYSLPFSNVVDNDSKDCVLSHLKKLYCECKNTKDRISEKMFNKFWLNKKRNINQILSFCNKYKIVCVVKDLVNNTIASNLIKPYTTKRRNALTFIAHNHHLYPIDISSADKVKSLKLTDKSNIIEYYEPDNLYIAKGKNIIAPNGIFKHTVEDISFEGFEKLHKNFSYECEKICSVSALNMCVIVDPNQCKSYQCWDMKKSYLTIINDIISKGTSYPIFTVCDRFEAYDGKLLNTSMYLVKCNLSELGYNNNLLSGYEINLLIDNEIMTEMDIDKVKHPSKHGLWDDFSSKMKGKEEFYKIICGCLAKKNITSNKVVYNIPEDEALGYYNNKYIGKVFKMKDSDKYSLNMSTSKHSYLNNSNISDFFISRCRLFILSCHFKIMKKYPTINLLKITTDSLTYNAKITGFDFLRRYFRDDTLKLKEKLEHDMTCAPTDFKIRFTTDKFNFIGKIDYDSEFKMIKNKCIIGKAGTGKTFKMNEEKLYDIKTSVSNVCCRHIGADKTLYSLLNIHDDNKFYKYVASFKNKVLWIDEFSMIEKFYYNYLFLLCLNGCKIIFTGDPGQIPPVPDPTLDYDCWFLNKFFGEKEYLTKNYRCDIDILKYGNDVAEGKRYEKKNNYKINDCNVHLAFTHNYKNNINRYIAKKRGIKWGDVGSRIIFKCAVKKYNIHKNEIYDIEKQVQIKEDGLKYADLGYCITIHSAQGLTIHDPFYVHQGERLSDRLFYTAITRGRNFEKLNVELKCLEKWSIETEPFHKYSTIELGILKDTVK